MRRSGSNALLYSGLLLSSSVVIERAFMRNMFSVDALMTRFCVRWKLRHPTMRHWSRTHKPPSSTSWLRLLPSEFCTSHSSGTTFNLSSVALPCQFSNNMALALASESSRCLLSSSSPGWRAASMSQTWSNAITETVISGCSESCSFTGKYTIFLRCGAPVTNLPQAIFDRLLMTWPYSSFVCFYVTHSVV